MSDHNKKGRFTTGNQAGAKSKRTKGIVSYIMAKTNNLEEVLDMAYDMLHDVDTKRSDKLKLIELFLDRAVGKPTQHQITEAKHDIVIDGPEKLIDDM